MENNKQTIEHRMETESLWLFSGSLGVKGDQGLGGFGYVPPVSRE